MQLSIKLAGIHKYKWLVMSDMISTGPPKSSRSHMVYIMIRVHCGVVKNPTLAQNGHRVVVVD